MCALAEQSQLMASDLLWNSCGRGSTVFDSALAQQGGYQADLACGWPALCLGDRRGEGGAERSRHVPAAHILINELQCLGAVFGQDRIADEVRPRSLVTVVHGQLHLVCQQAIDGVGPVVRWPRTDRQRFGVVPQQFVERVPAGHRLHQHVVVDQLVEQALHLA